MSQISYARGMDLVNALTSANSKGGSLVYTGGDTRTELLREPPRTTHDSLYIAQVIAARAGLQIPVVKSITRTVGATPTAGDLDLLDTGTTTANVYGGGFTSGSLTPDDAAGSGGSSLFAQLRNANSLFYGPGSMGVEVYGLLVELQAAQNVSLPSVEFDIRGCSMGASSYNSSATGTTGGATWSYDNATFANINLSGTVSPPSAGSSAQSRQRVRFLVLPAVAYNGLYYYTPFICRPTSNVTTASASVPVSAQTAGPASPGRAVIHCRLNSGQTFPTGTTINYQLLTRGTADVETLMSRMSQSLRTSNRLSALLKT